MLVADPAGTPEQSQDSPSLGRDKVWVDAQRGGTVWRNGKDTMHRSYRRRQGGRQEGGKEHAKHRSQQRRKQNSKSTRKSLTIASLSNAI